MILERDIYSAQPSPRRTEQQDHATLLISWWCTGFAFTIILFRLGGRWIRSEQFFAEDKIMAASIFPLLARMAFAHVVMLWGTNNTPAGGLTSTQINHAVIGARLVLAARIFYALFIWLAKITVSEFLKRMTQSFWNTTYQKILQVIRVILVLTFLAVFISTLTECQPVDHYWQVVPDPGPKCREGLAQAITMGACDMITDILLVAFPIPIIMGSSMQWKRKLSLSLLFMTSTSLIAVAAYRVVTIIDHRGLQQRRTLWASLEILTAAAVSNGLILGSFVRDRGVKKVKKYKAHDYPAERPQERQGSVGWSSINRTMTQQHWGSDEDLFRSAGCRLDSVTDYHGSAQKKKKLFGDIQEDKPLPRLPSSSLSEDEYKKRISHRSRSPSRFHAVSQNHDRRSARISQPPAMDDFDNMDLFDAGGILEQGDAPGADVPTNINLTTTHAQQPRSSSLNPPRNIDETYTPRRPRRSSSASSLSSRSSTSSRPRSRARPPIRASSTRPVSGARHLIAFLRESRASSRSSARRSQILSGEQRPPSGVVTPIMRPRGLEDTQEMDLIDAGGLLE